MTYISPDAPADAPSPAAAGEAAPAAMTPAVDVYEDDDGITLWADLPGVPKDGLSIHIQHNALTIEGAIDFGFTESMLPIHAEIINARYQRVFTLSRDLDADKAQASFEMGVLRLRIPKLMQESARRVEIRVT